MIGSISFRAAYFVLAWIVAAGVIHADQPAQTAPPPDAALIEFLGSDDTGDAKWWDFFERTSSKDETLNSDPPEDQKR